jgi:beta-phosphoglucomutase
MALLRDTGLPPGLALVFDLDGVIVDSNPIHSACWRVYFERLGVETPPDFDQQMYGKRNDEIVRRVFGPELTEAEVARRGAEKEMLYREMMAPKLERRLAPGLVEFLERRAAMPMGVATNAERANVDFVLDGGGLGRFFRVVLDAGQVSRPKPDPEIYLRAAQMLGVAAGDSIVFEDSLAGVEAARAAGARVVGLLTTHSELPVDLGIQDFLDPRLEAWLSQQRALV